jgi:pachytene checkpoint protein 2
MLFSRQNVDQNIISCNRLVLLHGPPGTSELRPKFCPKTYKNWYISGTGKTTLCKAIAQKISIRMKDQYSYAHLIEINSHSLFSKWFSEVGYILFFFLFQLIRLM